MLRFVVVILLVGLLGQVFAKPSESSLSQMLPSNEQEHPLAVPTNKIFVGKRISLNFQNIKIRAVLQLLAEFTGINIVVSDKVQGEITLRLNNVPWDQALDIILTTHGLIKRRTNNVMLIDTNESVAKLNQDQKQTQQNIAIAGPLHSELLQIKYAKAIDIAVLVKEKQNALLSEAGTVSADSRTNTLWIQDTKYKIRQLTDFIHKIDTPSQQVLIEARIVEVSKDFSQDLGIRWGVTKVSAVNGSIESSQQSGESGGLPLNRRLNLDLAASPSNFLTPASIGVAVARLGDGILLDLELSALESEGRAELISSPRLITTNQQPAVIESGQEIPYQETTRSGATAVAFKKAVLSLKVTPQITPDSTILMDLQINQDTPSHQTYNGVPAISTKEIQTNVLVNNGQTVVLGGIYKQDKNNTVNRVPFLGALPGIGGLFRNSQKSLINQELLIFLTPRIITDPKMMDLKKVELIAKSYSINAY